MIRTTALAGCALLFLLGGPAAACASGEDPAPAPAADDALTEALRAAEAARGKVADADRLAADATRARRLALLEAVRTEGALAEAFLRAGRDADAAASEARLRKLLSDLAYAGGAPDAPRGAGASPGAFRGRFAAPAARPATASAGLPAPTERVGHTAAKAVEEALAWLAAHQGPAGNWDADGFASGCKGPLCPGPGSALYDPGITALATLAFLGAGETHRTPKHGETVAKALKYLKSIQDAEGCFGPRTSSHFTYNHALCTLAMSEAFALTQSPLFKESAQAGVNFALSAQNPYLGWRYGVRPQDNDTSVTSWMVMALRSAKAAGLSVDDAAFEGAIAWFDKVTEPEYGRAGYTARGNGPARPQELMDAFPSDRSESMTAAAVIARLHCGQKPDNEWIRKGIDLVGKTLPAWSDDGGIDFYYWYFGTLASFQVGGDAWTKWNGAVEAALLPHQRGEGDGCARGSFDPVDPWSPEGGRVYSTAVNALTLEVCARYAAAFGGK